MAQIHWTQTVSGNFINTADWTGGAVPGPFDDAILDAKGIAYTVTADSFQTVNSIQTAANATLAIAGFYTYFTALSGTGAGANAGAITVGDSNQLKTRGVFDNTGGITLSGAGHVTELVAQTYPTTLTGGGHIVLSDSASNTITGGGGVRLVNVDNTISGAGTIGAYKLILTNQAKGVIDATGAINPLLLETGLNASRAITNAGLIEATGAAGLAIVNSIVDGAGGAIFAGAGSSVSLTGSTITGGGLDDALRTAAGGTITIGAASSADVQGPLANAGTIALASTGPASDLRILARGASLSGGGVVSLSGPRSRIYGVGPAATLANIDNTISGSGFIGLKSLTLVNHAGGTIDATGAGGLFIDTMGGGLTNAGLMEASAGAVLVLTGTIIDQTGGGTILAAAGGRVDLQGDIIRGGVVKSVGSGAVATDATGNVLDGRTAAVTVEGSLSVLNATNLQLAGAIENAGTIGLEAAGSATDLIVGIAGATLSAGGEVGMSGGATNRIYGAAPGATLTNVDNRITGGGLLGSGQLVLVNEAAGLILADSATAMIINTGAAPIVNAGKIGCDASGGLVVRSAVVNTGEIFAAGGAVTVAGAVTGTGVGSVNGGTLDFAAAFDQNVIFGKTGVLELAHAQAYTATISGFSGAGATALDLDDIAFIAGKTQGSYADNGHRTGGVLTVTDGTHTAHIALVGDYAGSTVSVSADGHGGTRVVDLIIPPPGRRPAAAHLVSAMAAFGAGHGGSGVFDEGHAATPLPTLARPA